MKKPFFLFIVFSILLSCENNPISIDTNLSKTEQISPETESASLFDSIRAQKLGADDYGMRAYVMAFLKTGPNRTQDSALAVQLQMAHMENIGRLADAGKLALAGPFFGDGDLRGIYIFAVETIEEAKALTETDPAIKAGSLEMELVQWYGSAALMEVNEIHQKIARIEF